MAELRRNGDQLEVRLTVTEKIAGLRGNIRVPASAVAAVEVADQPLSAVAGVRAPGLHLPGRTKIGTWRHAGRKTFAVARRGVPAIRVDLVGQRYDRLVISQPDAATVAEALG